MKQFAYIIIILTFSLTLQINSLDNHYGQVPPACPSSSTLSEVNIRDLPYNRSFGTPLVVPCGQHLIIGPDFDGKVPSGIIIEGILSFQDGGKIRIETPFIFVRGHVKIGSEHSPHKGLLHILLTDSENDLIIQNLAPLQAHQNTINFGRKAFASYGGAVSMYGDVSGPTFVRLVETAIPGDKRIRVDANVSAFWKPGDVLAIAATDYSHLDKSSKVIVEKVRDELDNTSTIFLSEHLQQYHIVREIALTDGSNRDIVLSPEVVKISRNVVISGMSPDTDCDHWLDAGKVDSIGGHFVISSSAEKQVVSGIAFVAMGQAGIPGRYPLHIHFGARVPPGSHFSHNVISYSKQRCVVVHATHGLVIESNIAFRTAGHCFMVEDGIEMDNVFRTNVGIGIRSAIALIDIGKRDIQSDDHPAIFWMPSAQNSLIGNIAAGSRGPGFWYELHSKLRGASRDSQLPGWADINMQTSQFHTFLDNVAHSTASGLSTYPPGSFPGETAVFDRFFAWSIHIGWNTPVGYNLAMTNSIIANVYSRGINSHHIHGHRVENTTIVGELYSDWNCRDRRDSPVYGFALENDGFESDRNCRTNYGIHIKIDETARYFPSASSFSKITFDNVDTPIKVQFDVKSYRQLAFQVSNVDLDNIQRNGYLVSDRFHGAEELTSNCTSVSGALHGMLFCPSQCWRHVVLFFGPIPNVSTTFVELTLPSGSKVVERAERSDRSGDMSLMVTKVLPAGTYSLRLLDANRVSVPNGLYNKWTFYFYRPDERLGQLACSEDVFFKVHGELLPEAV